jgi:hypothetical protein
MRLRRRGDDTHDERTDVREERTERVRDPGGGARGVTRGVTTLLGAAVAGLLLWLATTVGEGTNGDYWAEYGLLAAAGLAIALSQLLGGWTKWGWPRISGAVFTLGFVPALVAGGWVVLAHQPEGNWFRDHVLAWSSDIGVGGLVGDLSEVVPVIAFGLGLLFGITFDTTGPRVERVVDRKRELVEDRTAADEPVAAERRTVVHTPHGDREPEVVASRNRDTAVAPEPEPPPRPRDRS